MSQAAPTISIICKQCSQLISTSVWLDSSEDLRDLHLESDLHRDMESRALQKGVRTGKSKGSENYQPPVGALDANEFSKEICIPRNVTGTMSTLAVQQQYTAWRQSKWQ